MFRFRLALVTQRAMSTAQKKPAASDEGGEVSKDGSRPHMSNSRVCISTCIYFYMSVGGKAREPLADLFCVSPFEFSVARVLKGARILAGG